ncbi:hypothetical protein BC941DRAFT_420646 [Chlamydoabsidia padenii]|nr:hypothetical protein BC941DRAFT_420646 [Chlamydoabsidia padenii]
MDTLCIKLEWDNGLDYLSQLQVTFGAYIVSTQHSLLESGIVQLTCTIPLQSLVQSGDDILITLYVIVMSDPPHNVLDAWQVGSFTYLPRIDQPLDYTIMMKRTRPPSANDVTTHVSSTQPPPATSSQQNNNYDYYSLSQQYNMTLDSSSRSILTSTMPYYNESPPQLILPSTLTTSTSSFDYDMTNSTDTSTNTTTITMTCDYTDSSPRPSRRPAILPSPTTDTTTTTTIAITPTINHDPFAHLPSHGELIIEGNLNTMTLNWTDEETQTDRRLVRFWRRQQDNQIICHFEAIPPTRRTNTSQEIIISCIFWQDKQDHFITSVDIIYLLESLIGVYFTTEEKNRVRRNLENLRPLTVSRQNPDSIDFFNVIMAFDPPKPRNIEKNLKVFAWSSLATALKKIISKYSASYSSTASVTINASTG